MTSQKPKPGDKRQASETSDGLDLDAESVKDLEQDPKKAHGVRGGANFSRGISGAY